jgi:membrane protein implicated in regulation of membrane protease activity
VRRLRLSSLGERRIPRRPYRDTVIVYAVLAAVVVIVAAATGGGIVRAVIVAAAFFLVATAFSWWRWRERLRSQEKEQP